MAIEAPLSKYRRTNLKIYIAACLGIVVVFGYDGYLSKYPWSQRRGFYEEHNWVPLFDVSETFRGDLGAERIPEDLRSEFARADVELSAEALMSSEETDGRWVIADGPARYSIRQEGPRFAVYRQGPDGVMIFNQKAPPVFLGVAVLLGAYLYVIRGRKLLADDDQLVVAGKEKIPYNEIEQIDKTHFADKGFFVVVYRPNGGAERKCRLSDRDYDNLGPILDHLVAKIT